MEIVVCNNNSTDSTAAIAQEAGAKVVFEPINQIARARNTGAAAASGVWLIFVDADSLPTAELFEDVAVAMESGRYIGGGSTVRLDERIASADFMTGVWNLVSRTVCWAAGSFIFCEAKAFRAIGGFSNELFAGEEIDLSKKLKRLARKESKKMVILYRHPLRTSARKLHLYSRGELLGFMRKAMLRPRATMQNRGECGPWYDGRR